MSSDQATSHTPVPPPRYHNANPGGGSAALTRTALIVVTVLVVLGGVTFLAVSSMRAATLYRMVEEVEKDKATCLKQKVLQVHGFARNVPKEGRIEGEKIYREFDIVSLGGEARVHVVHEGVVPDTFKEMGETVATGKLTEENGRLVLTTVGGEKGIMAKCPSKYEEK